MRRDIDAELERFDQQARREHPNRLGGVALAGTPAAVREYMDEYVATGANYFVCSFQWGDLSHEEDRAQYNRSKGFRDEKGADGKRSSGNGSQFSYEFKQRLEPEPQCPTCSAVGMDHVISRKSGSGMGRGKQFITSPFQVIFCDQCGHVYGITGHSS
jgi:hypothetical protein